MFIAAQNSRFFPLLIPNLAITTMLLFQILCITSNMTIEVFSHNDNILFTWLFINTDQAIIEAFYLAII